MANGNLELAKLLWYGYILHKLDVHILCVDEKQGISSLGKADCMYLSQMRRDRRARCAEEILGKDKETAFNMIWDMVTQIGLQKRPSEEALTIFTTYINDDTIISHFNKIAPNIYTSINESIHNTFNSYRDKTKHYKHYSLLYKLAYLDVNENRGRSVKWHYSTNIRAWKKNHKKRTKRTVLQKKTYKWQDKALHVMFPQYKWFT